MNINDVYNDSELLFRHILEDKPNRADFRLHIHEECEILYFINGSASCLVETTSYPLVPDTLIIMRPMESHMINILADAPYERFTVNFSTELLNGIDPEHKLLIPFFDRALGEKNVYRASDFEIHPKQLFSAMADRCLGEDERKRTVLINLYALLMQIVKAFSEKKEGGGLDKKSLAAETAAYINAHLYEELSVQSLANNFYVSVSQLNRQFKKATGFSIWSYIVSKRLVSARNLIRDGVSATQAYTKCGFNDYSSFYRLYLKKFGSSPKDDMIKKK